MYPVAFQVMHIISKTRICADKFQIYDDQEFVLWKDQRKALSSISNRDLC